MAKCRAGDGKICTLLGYEYLRGDSSEFGSFPQDNKLAAEFYARGCNLGSPEGCGQLGELTLAGSGVPRDDTKGAALVIDACERGYAKACASAGQVLLAGRGVAYDGERAVQLLTRACTAGDAGACAAVTHLIGTGDRTPGDPPTGAAGFPFGTTIADLKRACEKAGHHFSSDPKDSSVWFCDGTATADMPFEVLLTACAGHLCSITLRQTFNDQSSKVVVNRLDEIEQSLTKRYGTPSKRERKIPTDCRADDAFARCIASKKASFGAIWIWEAGFVLSVDIATTARGEGAIGVMYATPQSLKAFGAAGL